MDNFNMPNGSENENREVLQSTDSSFQPGRVYEKPNTMATASQICGIIAIISVFTMTIYPAVILGALAIILGILSRGGTKKYGDRAKTGLVTGIVAIGIDVALVAATLMLIFSDGEFKQLLNETCKEVYGQTFDDMMEDAMDGSIDLDYYNIPKM